MLTEGLIKKTSAIGITILFLISSFSLAVVGHEEIFDKNQIEECCKMDYVENYAEYNTFDDNSGKSNENENRDSVDALSLNEQIISMNIYSPTNDPMDSPWPMKCHDLRHTGRSQYSTADNPGYEKWRFRSEWDGTMESSAIIGDNGTIYFGTMGSDRRLYALYPNGTKKWSYQVGATIWSTPAIAEDGTIYVTSYDDYLHAVYPNGTRKWKFKASDLSSSPAIGEYGTIYFGGFNNNIYAVNPNGTEKWRYKTGNFIVSDPAIGIDGTIYIGSADHHLYAMYPNGTLRWRFKTGDWVKSHPSIAEDGTIYFDSFDDYFYALYPNGTLRWKLNLDGMGCGSAAIGYDGTIYFCGRKLHAILPNGTIKWNFDLGGGDAGHTSPAISADGTIYICTDEGKHLIAVNPDGTEKWRKQICNLYAESSPCIGEDGTIYVGSSWEDENTHMWFGYLHAFGELDPNAPDAPTITGETSGKAGKEYEYKFASTDPNDNDVYYYIEWGDGAVEDWIGPYGSGEEITLNHTWKSKGTYTIRARAKDTNNLWGPWSELEVTMPKNKPFNFNFNLLSWLFERFPRMFPILRQLLELAIKLG